MQRVVAKFDRIARELPSDVLAILTPVEVEEWKHWRVKEDEEQLAAASQFELDTLAESLRIARVGASKGCATTTPENAEAIRTEVRALMRALTKLGLMPEPVRGRPEKGEEFDSVPMALDFARPGTLAYECYLRMIDEHGRKRGNPSGVGEHGSGEAL